MTAQYNARIKESINLIELSIWGLGCGILLYMGIPMKMETMPEQGQLGEMMWPTLLPNKIIIAEGLLINNLGINLVKILILISTCIIIKLGQTYFIEKGLHKVGKKQLETGIILMILATIGMCLLISSKDLISLYVALELQSLSLYVLTTIVRNKKSTEGALKYFVLGAMATGFILFGSTYVYGSLGSGDMEIITWSSQGMEEGEKGLLMGITLILIGLLLKLSAAPWHMWTPDVYEGAPTIITAYFSVVPKLALLVLGVRIYLTSGVNNTGYLGLQYIIILAAISSMIIGSISALNQTQLKRLLAYSTIGHVGYILIGVSLGTYSGLEGSIFYLLIYMTAGIAIFIMVLSLKNREKIVELFGLGKLNTTLGISLVILLFSIGGIPPLSGFISKFLVFYAAIESGGYFIAIIGVLASVVSILYYLKLIRYVYQDSNGLVPLTAILDTYKKEENEYIMRPYFKITNFGSLLLGLLIFITLFLIINPSPVFLAAGWISQELVSGGM